MSETPENIYRRVLEIGSECLTCGISFNELKERLIDEGYQFDDGGCLERCLREWFFNSFFHEEMACKHGTYNFNELNKHLTCNFIMKSDSCMKLLTFKEAENNRATSENNLKSVKKANLVAYIALTVAVLSFGYQLFGDFSNESVGNRLIQSNQELTNTIKSFGQSRLSKVSDEVYNVQDSLNKSNLIHRGVSDKDSLQ